MYYRNTQTVPDAEYALEALSRKFAGRGLAAKTGMYAHEEAAAPAQRRSSYNERRATSSHPMTLDEFSAQYRARSAYRESAQTVAAARNNMQFASPRTQVERNSSADMRAPVNGAAKNTQLRNASPAAKKRAESSAVVKKEASMPQRRAVKEAPRTKINLGTLGKNFRHLPVATILVVVACAVSLMFIVGSSVMLSDASNDYLELQSEVSKLAKQESELSVALEMKNNLRTIESIAVDKLGMVSKDLISKQYISLTDEDIIETYDEENTNVGLSTLLAAIRGGN
ncbi:MAG: hypothetical protein ACI4QZ_08490 [Eubacteriales bacterium]